MFDHLNICLLSIRQAMDCRQQGHTHSFRTIFDIRTKFISCLSCCIDFVQQWVYANYIFHIYLVLQKLYQHPSCQWPNRRLAPLRLLNGNSYILIIKEFNSRNHVRKQYLHSPSAIFLSWLSCFLLHAFCSYFHKNSYNDLLLSKFSLKLHSQICLRLFI